MTLSLPQALVSSTQSGAKITCICQKCGHFAMITVNEGDDGIEVARVESFCKHIKDTP